VRGRADADDVMKGDRQDRVVVIGRDTLRSRCWCDSHEVDVPTADVARGVTVSCGARGCDEVSMRERAARFGRRAS